MDHKPRPSTNISPDASLRQQTHSHSYDNTWLPYNPRVLLKFRGHSVAAFHVVNFPVAILESDGVPMTIHQNWCHIVQCLFGPRNALLGTGTGLSLTLLTSHTSHTKCHFYTLPFQQDTLSTFSNPHSYHDQVNHATF